MPSVGYINYQFHWKQVIKNSLFGIAQKLLAGLVWEDVKMIEKEQFADL